tara:strand:+ start:24 stop:755 length:732 start_codon:yes stop_codon:yes gene_type:complete
MTALRNWSLSDCEELAAEVKKLLDFKPPNEVAEEIKNNADRIAENPDLGKLSSIQKNYAEVISSFGEEDGDPIGNALKTNDVDQIVTTCLFQISEASISWARTESLKNELKGQRNIEEENGWKAMAVLQILVIGHSLGAAGVDQKLIDFSEKFAMISALRLRSEADDKAILLRCQTLISDKEIYTKIISPCISFIAGLLVIIKPIKNKVIVSFTDQHLCSILAPTLDGLYSQAIAVCEQYLNQ